MDRYELHKVIDRYFANQKFYLFEVFRVGIDDLKPYIDKLKGYRIPVKVGGEIGRQAKDRGISEKELYNAMLEYLLDRYSNIQNIEREINRWKEETILRFV